MNASRLLRFRSLLAIPAVLSLGLGACSNDMDGSSGTPADPSSSSGGTSDSDVDYSDDEPAGEVSDTSSDAEESESIGTDNEPSGDGLSGDELAESISRQYQSQWSEFFGMPMDADDAPVRCDALEAEVDATTDCEVDMGGTGGGMWMPLKVTVTAVSSVGIEYQVMPFG